MKVQFRGDKRLVEQARRARAGVRLGLLLGRFGDEVHSVTLSLSTIADPSGPPGKRCEIAVALEPKRLRVEHTDADLSVALDRASDKAARSIARTLQQEHDANPFGKTRSSLGPGAGHRRRATAPGRR